jgi:hypothetical protein
MNHKKHEKQPWITAGIIKSLKTKSKMHKQNFNAKSPQQQTLLTDKYNRYRNMLTQIIRKAKTIYWNKVFTETKYDIKQTWKNINNILRKTRNKHNFPNSFSHDGKILTNHNDIANAFNKYYINIGPSTASSIPQTTTNLSSLPIIPQASSFFMTPTTDEEIIRIIKQLKPKTSCGFDNINSKIIKLSNMTIALPLAHIINLSLSHGIVPNQMKLAKVIPIYKDKETNLIKNYRPISLLPSFSKILEKVVYKRLYNYFQEYNLLYSSQYGFRKNFSTELAILEFQNSIIKYIQNKKHCLGLFLDLSKAFDSLQHDILLNKMKHYGIRGVALDWFNSYISNRIQYVSYQNVNSINGNIMCGVPQGSVLGPLLFLIYTNDLPNISNHGKFVLFADDTNVIYTSSNIDQFENSINDDLQKIGDWFNSNKLSVNVGKTKYIMFGPKPYTQIPKLRLQLNNISIEQTDNIKFLGIIIQHNLSWEAHITNKCNKISQINAILSRLKNILPLNILETIYRSLIEPHLTYGVIAWGNATNKSLRRMKILQKRSVRQITKSKYNSHTDPIFIKLKILKFDDIIQLFCCKFYYKKVKGLLPSFHIKQLLTHEECNQNTRTT